MPSNRVYYTVLDAPDRSTQSALGRCWLREMVTALSGLSEQQFCIATEPSGRPMVAAKNGNFLGVFVSLAHSGPVLACAATLLGPIGIDVERPREGRDLAGIAETAFGPAECRRCMDEGAPGFYRVWTLREAMAKATGMGLPMVGDRQDRAAQGPDQGNWRWQDWHLAHHRLGQETSFALAVLPERSVTDITWQDFTPTGASLPSHSFAPGQDADPGSRPSRPLLR